MPHPKNFTLSVICDAIFVVDLSLDDCSTLVSITFYDVSNEGTGSTSLA